MPAVYRLCGEDRNGRLTRLDALARGPRALLEIALAVIGAGLVAQVSAQQPAGDYATELGVVYAGYQRILAVKEACDEAAPGTRPANTRAFSEWQARHAALLSELKKRVSDMIRGASKDERDYARKLGKYEGGDPAEPRRAENRISDGRRGYAGGLMPTDAAAAERPGGRSRDCLLE